MKKSISIIIVTFLFFVSCQSQRETLEQSTDIEKSAYYVELGNQALVQSQPEKAEVYADKAISYNIKNDQAYGIKAKYYYGQKNYSEALANIEKALSLNNKTLVVIVYYNQYYLILSALGKNKEALEALNLGLRKYPDASYLNYQLAKEYEKTQDYSAAIKIYNRLLLDKNWCFVIGLTQEYVNELIIKEKNK